MPCRADWQHPHLQQASFSKACQLARSSWARTNPTSPSCKNSEVAPLNRKSHKDLATESASAHDISCHRTTSALDSRPCPTHTTPEDPQACKHPNHPFNTQAEATLSGVLGVRAGIGHEGQDLVLRASKGVWAPGRLAALHVLSQTLPPPMLTHLYLLANSSTSRAPQHRASDGSHEARLHDALSCKGSAQPDVETPMDIQTPHGCKVSRVWDLEQASWTFTRKSRKVSFRNTWHPAHPLSTASHLRSLRPPSRHVLRHPSPFPAPPTLSQKILALTSNCRRRIPL